MKIKDLCDRLDKLLETLEHEHTQSELMEALEFENKLQSAEQNIKNTLEHLAKNPDDTVLTDRLRSYQNRLREVQERRAVTKDIRLGLRDFIKRIIKE